MIRAIKVWKALFWSEQPERFCLASINVNGLVDVDFRQS